MSSDLVIALDRQQGWSNPAARRCPNDGTTVKLEQSKIAHKEHGNLQSTANGFVLVCGVCGYNEPANDPRN
jgi:hypothetical protein